MAALSPLTATVPDDKQVTEKVTSAAIDRPAPTSAGRRRARSLSDGNTAENTRKESLGGAVARSLLGSLAFFFRLPIRLFRPVKLSSWTVLESFARREKKTLSLKYLIGLIRREKNSFLFHLLGPPIVFNTLVGFALFESYSLCEAHLLKKSRPDLLKAPSQEEKDARKTSWTPLWIVTISGSVAGAAQCILSAPLDNVRLVLASHRPVGRKSGGVGGEAQHGRHRRMGGRRGLQTKPSLISWRSVMKAAILPFAPSESHRRLVSSVRKQSHPATSLFSQLNWSGSLKGGDLMTKQQRRVLQQTLRHWSGGVHGAGLLMSLARDSVGFASFFFVFECSRRVAHASSLTVDRAIAWFNAGAAVPGIRSASATDTDAHSSSSSHHPSHTPLNVDFSYNASRTKTGRVVAAFVLLVGGAVGALLYEVVGRPAELMRVVIWQGRQAWQRQRARQSRVVRGARSERHVMRGGSGGGEDAQPRTVRHLGMVSKKRRERVAKIKAQQQRGEAGETATTTTTHSPPPPRTRNPRTRTRSLGLTAANYSSSRLESLLTLRAANSAGTRLSRLGSVLNANHTPHPLRAIGRAKRQIKASATKSPLETTTAPPPPPTPHVDLTPPSALSLLLAHAERTSTLAYTSDSRKFRTAVPAPVLLLHTYFLAPYLARSSSEPFISASGRASQTGQLPHLSNTQSQRQPSQTTASAARLLSKWINRNPVSSGGPASSSSSSSSSSPLPQTTTFLPPRPAASPNSVSNTTLARQWGSGRVAWALRRLASPYGIGFVAFAWMSGDV